MTTLIRPETGVYPWIKDERDNWWYCRWETPAGTSMEHYQRTAHAHAIGRAVLADLRARYNEPPASVEVYEYDTDTNTRPAITTAGGVINVRFAEPVAVVTDPRPVGRDLEQFEKDLEAARMAKRRYDALYGRLVASMREAHDAAEPGHPDYRSANQIAAMTQGVISRPTVLKHLDRDEDDAEN